MNLLKGSLYVFFQSYKKQNIIFWIILFSIVFLSFFLDSFFGKYISFAITISIPVYIFYSTMASKILNRTMPYFLKLGLSRIQYVLHIGLFFLTWSIAGAVIIACTHEIITFFSKLLDVKDIIIIHPILLFDTTQPFLLIVAFDFVLLLFCLISGLLLNVVFYRFGTIGGYSFIGALALIPIVMITFQWYTPLFEMLSKASFIAILSSFLLMILLLYTLITGALRNASAIPA
ncbi:hypothetical protein ACIQ2D_01930 [Lysinibacillus sp. NPDC097287]|uniref:hypothetical protein n=1 Tax=Lysinibacillus sp. NPDC097287 TaxID=3364144 RepID=UPI0038233B18